MIDVNEWTTEMLKTLFPDVSSVGMSCWAMLFIGVGIVFIVMFCVALKRDWGDDWEAFYFIVGLFLLIVGGFVQKARYDEWHDETLPGRLAGDPEAAVVVQNVRDDLQWINKRAEERRKLRKAKKKDREKLENTEGPANDD